ncbi:MAG: exodeoxyribonuclease VII small subunit [Prevotella sp.]|nr:exodeoxyribonuclease VII small subunit [Prevotella sp.]
MSTINMKYEEALAKLEKIVRLLESGECDIDQMADQLKEAKKLIKMCRDRLTKTDEEIAKILDEQEE